MFLLGFSYKNHRVFPLPPTFTLPENVKEIEQTFRGFFIGRIRGGRWDGSEYCCTIYKHQVFHRGRKLGKRGLFESVHGPNKTVWL